MEPAIYSSLEANIWCGIPVFNNAKTIADIATRCRQHLSRVLVIDDGSTDADLTQLLAGLDVMVVRHPTNLGKGRAILTAFDYAAGHGAEYLITLDGDGQHFPEDLPRFLSRLRPGAISLGYRAEVTGDMPASSRFGREFSDFWVTLEAGGNARDTQSGYRAYPLAAVRQLRLWSHFYNFEMEILAKAMWAGMRTQSVPIRVWYPPARQRVSSFHPLRDNLRISLLHTRLMLRQILPIPHRRIQLEANAEPRPPLLLSLLNENTSPLGLATALGVSILMMIVLWPWGIIAVTYVAIRLHLNKFVAATTLVLYLLPRLPDWCMRAGSWVVKAQGHPHLRWIVGSHIVALPLAVLLGWLLYAWRRRQWRDRQT